MSTIAELARDYRSCWDLLDELDGRRKEINARMENIEREIRTAMELSGKTSDGDADSVAGVMRVTLRKKWRAQYEPEKWPEIVKSLVASGHDYLIQRRLSDSKVMELVDQGIPLPEGLSVTPYDDLDFRRL